MRTFPLAAKLGVLTALAAAGLLFSTIFVGPAPQSAAATPHTEVKKLVASDAEALDYFGRSVAVSGDTTVVGASGDSDAGSSAGAVYILQRNQGGADNWGEVKKLTASDAQAADFFGYSVAVSGDTAVVGAWGEDAGGVNAGAAYVFHRNQGGADNWGEVKKLTASDAQAGDHFGYSVAVSGDTIVVGAEQEDAGAAYVFQRAEGGVDNWGEVKKLTASDAAAKDRFGRSVTVDVDTAIVGALFGTAKGTGAAYVFRRDEGGSGNWGEVKKLTASDGEAGDRFGVGVAAGSDTIVVGASAEDAGGSDAGAAYVFQRNQGGADNWGEVKKLTASDAQAGDYFGRSVAVSGDNVILGANAADSGGAAYVVQRDEGGADNWGELTKLTASGPSSFFGSTVAVSGSTAIVGDWPRNAAYVFDLLILKPTPTNTPTPTPVVPAAMSLRVTNDIFCSDGQPANEVCVGQGLKFDIVVQADAIPPYGYTNPQAWINYGDDLGTATGGAPKGYQGLSPYCPGLTFFPTSYDTNDNGNDDAAVASCDSSSSAPAVLQTGPLFAFTLGCTLGSSSQVITLEASGGPNAGYAGSHFVEPASPSQLVVPANSGAPDFIVDSLTVNCVTPPQPEPIDTDGDGCSDQREIGPDETLGGLRYFTNPWDFYDVLGPGASLPLDQIIDLPNDILGVIQRFSPTGAPPYDAAFDRGASSGPYSWNLTKPDGVIDLPNDILGVIQQFGHSCA